MCTDLIGDAVFNCKGMDILNIDLNNIILEYNFDEDHPDTIILVRLLAWHEKFKEHKELKKEFSKELMSKVWHLDRQWDWCLSEDEKKKEVDPMFMKEL